MLSAVVAVFGLLLAHWVDSASITPELVQAFTPGEFKFSGGDNDKGEVFRYRLFEPKPTTPGVKYPLIVWMHGYGDIEISRDNFGQLKHLLLVIDEPTKPEKY